MSRIRFDDYIPSKKDSRDFKYSVPFGTVVPKVIKVDLRGLSYTPPVWDQGQLGACVLHGCGAVIQFARGKQGLPAFKPSMLFPYYNVRLMEGTLNQDAGCQPRDAIKTYAKQGDVPDIEWPYVMDKFATKPPAKVYQDALQYQILIYRKLTGLVQIRQCLYEGFPITNGLPIRENFPENSTDGLIPMPKGQLLGRHMTAIWGCDDTARTFIWRNSWGTGWGDKGYGYIPYDYITKYATDLWTIRLVE